MCVSILYQGEELETVGDVWRAFPWLPVVRAEQYTRLEAKACLCQIDVERTFPEAVRSEDCMSYILPAHLRDGPEGNAEAIDTMHAEGLLDL